MSLIYNHGNYLDSIGQTYHIAVKKDIALHEDLFLQSSREFPYVL